MNINDILENLQITFQMTISPEELESKIGNLYNQLEIEKIRLETQKEAFNKSNDNSRDENIEKNKYARTQLAIKKKDTNAALILVRRWVQLAPQIKAMLEKLSSDNYLSKIDRFINSHASSIQDVEIIFPHLNAEIPDLITKIPLEKRNIRVNLREKKTSIIDDFKRINTGLLRDELELNENANSADLVKFVAKGADIDTKNSNDLTIIHILAANKDVARMEELLRIFTLDFNPDDTVSPLFFAEGVDMIQLIVSHGGNLLATAIPAGKETEITALDFLINSKKANAEQLLAAELNKTPIAKENENGIEKQAIEVNFEILRQLYQKIGKSALPIKGTISHATLAHMCVLKLNAELSQSTLTTEDINWLFQEFIQKWEFQVILDSNLELSDESGKTARSLMLRNMKKIYKLCLQMKRQVTNVDELSKQLEDQLDRKMAADTSKITDLITRGARANTRTNEGWTAVHAAAALGAVSLIKILALKSIDCNVRTGNLETKSNKKKGFFKKKTEVNDTGWRPLERAPTIETILALVEAGANLHEKNAQRKTLWSVLGGTIIKKTHATDLLTAILMSEKADERDESIKALIKLGAVVAEAEQKSGKRLPEKNFATKLFSPNKSNQPSMESLKHDINNEAHFFEKTGVKTRWDHFIEANVITQESAAEILSIALDTAPSCDLDLIKKILNTFTLDINTVGKISGWTVVHAAAQAGDFTYINELVKKGADVNHKKAIDGSLPPLCCAADANTVITLLAAGAKPGLTNTETKDTKLAGAEPNIRDTEIKYKKNAPLKPLSFLILKQIIKHAKDASDVLALLLDKKDCDLELVEELINLGADLNIRGKQSGFSAVHIAAIQDLPSFLHLFAEKGAHVNSLPADKNPPPLSYAKSVKAVEILIKNKADITWKTNNDNSTLELNDRHNNVTEVNHDSAGSFDKVIQRINMTPAQKTSLLCTVLDMEPSDPITIRHLIFAGAEVDTKGKVSKLCALHIAAQRGDTTLIEILQAKGADVNLTAPNGEPPLFLAKNVPTLIALLEADVSHEAKFKNKDFLTHLRIKPAQINALLEHELGKAEKAKLPLIEFYLGHKANIKATSASGHTIMHIAAYHNRMDLIEKCLKAGMDINCSPSLLCMTTDIDTINKLIRLGISVTRRDFFQDLILKGLMDNNIINQDNVYSVLVALLEAPILDMLAIKHLSEFGAVPNTQAVTDALCRLLDSGENPDRSLIRLLIDIGASADAQGNRSGRTATHVAARNDDTKLLSYLAKKGANFNRALTSTGFPPIFIAKGFETVKKLLRGDAALSYTANDWNALTYLQRAKKITANNASEILGIVMDQKGTPDIQSIKRLIEFSNAVDIFYTLGEKSKQTLAHVAAKAEDGEYIKQLAEYGLLDDPNKASEILAIVLDWDETNIDLIKALITLYDANPSTKGPRYGRTAVHAAALCDDDTFIEELAADSRVDVSIEDQQGHPPLFYVTQNINAVKVLMQYDAPLFKISDDEVPPFEVIINQELLTPENTTTLWNTIQAMPNYPNAKLVSSHLVLEYQAELTTHDKKVSPFQLSKTRSSDAAHLSSSPTKPGINSLRTPSFSSRSPLTERFQREENQDDRQNVDDELAITRGPIPLPENVGGTTSITKHDNEDLAAASLKNKEIKPAISGKVIAPPTTYFFGPRKVLTLTSGIMGAAAGLT
ncbi:MAG: hypothetical protein K2Q14_03080, partial [Gammaproteobacteria bacterium]|nr:hypothetical protein [Gammaproteobacteria bacterium]